MVAIVYWILITLALTTGTMVLSKRYGSAFVIAIYTGFIVMAQIFAAKLVVFGNWVVPAGVIVYGISFLLTDVLNEFYGKEEAKKALVSGFVSSIFLVLGIQIVIAWEPAVFWPNQEALVTVLGATWRIVLASLVAYLISQSWDIYVFQLLRAKTNGKYLWLRNLASTISSQLIDTLIFCVIAFAGYLATSDLVIVIQGQLAVKFLIAILDTPFLYGIRLFLKKEVEVA